MSNDAVQKKPVGLDRLLTRCPGVDKERLTQVAHAAYDQFVEEGKQDGELSLMYPDIPRAVIRMLIKEFGWIERRRDYLEQLKLSADVEYVKSLRDTRLKTAKELVESISPVAKELMEKMSSKLTSDDIVNVRRLAEAFGQVSAVLMKAAGVDAVASPLLSADPKGLSNEQAGGRAPWAINASGPVTVVQPQKEQEIKPVLEAEASDGR